MASSTPACARTPERRLLRSALALLFVVALAGCAGNEPTGSFEITDAHARWHDGGVIVTIRQRIDLGPQVEEALLNGVDITIRMDAALYGPGGMAREVADMERYVIRYLPLSEHFELTPPRDAPVQTYPRLRHVLASLGEIRLPLSTDADPSADWELRVRARLDQGDLPAPMQLPAWLSGAWRLDTDWTRWPLGGNA